MNAIDLIEDMLPHIKEYTTSEDNPTVDGFMEFMQSKSALSVQSSDKPDSAIAQINTYDNGGTSLAFHLNRLGKYAKYYVKEAFREVDLINGDDFAFLASVIELKSLSKSKLIAYNVHEIPSGMEVIKRLLSKGMIKEHVDPEDRRIKLLSATDKGKKTLMQAMQEMSKVARIVRGNLNDQELNTLNDLLRRLDHFHEDIYKEEDNALDAVLARHFH